MQFSPKNGKKKKGVRKRNKKKVDEKSKQKRSSGNSENHVLATKRPLESIMGELWRWK